ncbi:protein mono-ADP-ribosyltransferase PARP12-like isoform X2 [Megalops cyprinoides]|uniref:protein mono-ADP-ribosyltransferase PARP12-like isoform X2 n=1 Tax=Megalops cyprinoides TaxID=118141 RepID=UPI00186510A1|nr:protein mono-ADP-ribosyltransferase PARP12-like isoform X2 [Megalops cyprinoides]
MTESLMIKVICFNNGAMEYGELADIGFGLQNLRGVFEIVIGNSELFSITTLNGIKRVVAKTKVRLCKARDCNDCCNLHLCKAYLYGDCTRRGRRGCRFGHNLRTEHNAQVLRDNNLHELDRRELCTLLLQNDNTLLPPVCFSYNKGTGEFGSCPDQQSCRRLHICERYLRGTCRSGVDCPRSHDFFEPHPLKTLQERGIPSELIGSMFSVYQNIQALKNNSSNTQSTQHTGKTSAGRSAPEKTEICMYYVKGSCKHGDKCQREHSTLPYKWEVKFGKSWSPVPDNEEMERDFCNPFNEYSGGSPPVHFDTMTRGSAQVRRLSTVSSVVQPTFILTTEWAWYWQDEYGNWIQYASLEGQHRLSSITGEDLEKKYQEDCNAVVEFAAGSQTYKLSFQDMTQTNERYGTKRLVRRRPVFVSAADAEAARTSKKGPYRPSHNFKAVPGHWDKTLMPDTGYKKVTLQASISEYKKILDLFNMTMMGFRISSIERIQNRALWEVFQWQRDLMRKNNGGKNVTEKLLFHGTDSKHNDAICLQNFDWRICGTHGTAYGKGSYFARDAKYSHSYTSSVGMRTMFVCRVLVGNYTKGNSSYLRPPSKDGGDTIFYDSCVDDVYDPSIFVVFEKHQVYPEYLIQYDEDMIWARSTVTVSPAQVPPQLRLLPGITKPAQAPPPATTSTVTSQLKQAPPPFSAPPVIAKPAQAPPPATTSTVTSQLKQAPPPFSAPPVIAKPAQAPPPATTFTVTSQLKQAPPPFSAPPVIAKPAQAPPPATTFTVTSQLKQAPPPFSAPPVIAKPAQAPPPATTFTVTSQLKQAPPPFSAPPVIAKPAQAPPPATTSTVISQPKQVPPPVSAPPVIAKPAQAPEPLSGTSVSSDPLFSKVTQYYHNQNLQRASGMYSDSPSRTNSSSAAATSSSTSTSSSATTPSAASYTSSTGTVSHSASPGSTASTLTHSLVSGSSSANTLTRASVNSGSTSSLFRPSSQIGQASSTTRPPSRIGSASTLSGPRYSPGSASPLSWSSPTRQRAAFAQQTYRRNADNDKCVLL